MDIPIVIVDDQDVDRYLVKRNVAKTEGFGTLIEMENGDKFLEHFFGEGGGDSANDDTPILVLMDVNMPGRSGFDTAELAQQQLAEGRGRKSLVVMMFTSSNNFEDKARAEQLEIVKGYVSKPLNKKSIQYIKEIYSANS